MRSRIAVLASGGGSNLQALLDHLDELGEQRAGDIVLVASDRPDAGALVRAAARGVATARVEAKAGVAGTRPLDELLRERDADLIVLAGYLRLVPLAVVERYRGRIMNVHPALLPAFGGAGMYGTRVHRAVLASGATVSGVTVHFVDQAYDRGAVIAQWPVPVLPQDTAESLAARVLRVEHALYPRAVQAVAAGRISLAANGTVLRPPGPTVLGPGAGWPELAFCLSTAAGPRLASEVARMVDASI